MFGGFSSTIGVDGSIAGVSGMVGGRATGGIVGIVGIVGGSGGSGGGGGGGGGVTKLGDAELDTILSGPATTGLRKSKKFKMPKLT